MVTSTTTIVPYFELWPRVFQPASIDKIHQPRALIFSATRVKYFSASTGTYESTKSTYSPNVLSFIAWWPFSEKNREYRAYDTGCLPPTNASICRRNPTWYLRFLVEPACASCTTGTSVDNTRPMWSHCVHSATSDTCAPVETVCS